jgi:hypothetical protein
VPEAYKKLESKFAGPVSNTSIETKLSAEIRVGEGRALIKIFVGEKKYLQVDCPL